MENEVKDKIILTGDNYRGYWIEADLGAGDSDIFIKVYQSKEIAESDTELEKMVGGVIMREYFFEALIGPKENIKEIGNHSSYMRALDMVIDALKKTP